MVHCSNYIFPLFTLPYLVRVLGAENFGVLAIIQAICQYVILVTDFGFNFSSTRDISINRKNKGKITSIFYSTILAKILLFILSVGLLVLISIFIPWLREKSFLVIISLLGVIGNIMFPIWLFQGLEKMVAISIISTIAKTVVLAFTFMFVKTIEDLDVAIIINSLSFMITGILSLCYVYHKKMVLWSHPDFNQAIIQMKMAFPLFLSSISTSLYTTMNTLLLGLFCPVSMVGLYAAADKLRTAAQGLYNPIRQAIFPRAVAMSSNKNWVMLVIKNYGVPFILFGFLMALAFFVIGPIFIKYYFGVEFEEAGKYILLMAPIPFIVAIATVFGHWIIIAGGHSNVLGKIYLSISLLHVAYAIPLVRKFGANGIIGSVILTETVITALLIYFVYVKRNEINLIKT